MASSIDRFELFTIGVYGTTPRRFFEALETARIRTFVDVRARRGVRGKEYSFANAARLVAELDARGIVYLHLPALAPDQETREAQWAADEETNTPKRLRAKLAPEFANSYREKVLDRLDPRWFLDQIGDEPGPTVLMCVEREASACHRSLLADSLHKELGVTVHHLAP